MNPVTGDQEIRSHIIATTKDTKEVKTQAWWGLGGGSFKAPQGISEEVHAGVFRKMPCFKKKGKKNKL